ncbi:hypothetical protein KIPE111705_46890 [Kibdelosporangium persicum]|uniref:hypothetical protein n=1 Tax=Kibdelosporangium persicum TaxID=2698649 RepID=UPI00156395BC|nr:hypothetical protein [Kibdelosporangium persicum]
MTIDTDGTAGSATAMLEATDWHPIWVADLNAWVPIANIKAGSWLRTSTGTWVQVTAVRKYTNNTPAHDLTIDGINSYHVRAGSISVLVHNCDGGNAAAQADLGNLRRGLGLPPAGDAKDVSTVARLDD